MRTLSPFIALAALIAVGALWRANQRNEEELRRIRALLASRRAMTSPTPASPADLAGRIAEKQREVDALVEKLQQLKSSAASDDPEFFAHEIRKKRETIDSLQAELREVKEQEGTTRALSLDEKARIKAGKSQNIEAYESAIREGEAAVRDAQTALQEAKRHRTGIQEKQGALNGAKADLLRLREEKQQALARLDSTAAQDDADSSSTTRALKRSGAEIGAEIQREKASLAELMSKRESAVQARSAAETSVRTLESDYTRAMNDLQALQKKAASTRP